MVAQRKRREFLIEYLLSERGEEPASLEIPRDEDGQRHPLRIIHTVGPIVQMGPTRRDRHGHARGFQRVQGF